MSRYHSYINTAKTILERYKGEEPFAAFLKKFFSLDKKYGSKDRKQVSHLCYCYFRLGKMVQDVPVEERLLLGLFLCSDQPNEILQELKPGWNDKAGLTISEKFSPPDRISRAGMLNAQCSIFNVFPWKHELSDGINHEKFSQSFFMQPDLFLRLRPGYEKMVKEKLQNAGITFRIISDTCIALPNSSKIDGVIEVNREAVVQDYNSQRTGQFVSLVRRGPSDKGRSDRVWDCCAGSGGKSIMLYDLYPGIDLTVSDIRESIIINLKKRFKEAGITNYKSIVANLTGADSRLPTPDFGLILCDVPCTGSGTWSRTPEQLYSFDEEKINKYVSLQRKILSNVIPHLDAGGYLLYITCSVFKKENEEAVEFIKQKFDLQLIKMEVLKGYDKKADTLFAALLQKAL